MGRDDINCLHWVAAGSGGSNEDVSAARARESGIETSAQARQLRLQMQHLNSRAMQLINRSKQPKLQEQLAESLIAMCFDVP